MALQSGTFFPRLSHMHNLHRVGLVFTVAVVTLSVAVLPAAQSEPLNLQGGSSVLCPGPEQYSSQRPRASEGPTPVGVGVLLVDLVSLDDVDQSFTADVALILRWSDPRLADPARGRSVSVCPNAADRAWMPVVQFQGVREFEKHYQDVIGIDAAGTVTHAQRLSMRIAVPLDLRDFPFDRHSLAVDIGPVFSSVEEIEFSVLDELTGVGEGVALTGWTLGVPTASVEIQRAPRLQINRSLFRLQVEATLEAGFFVWKALAPLTLIIFMSWAVFWIDPKEIGPQLGLAGTSMLTLIAFQFAFTGLLPRISYLTRADRLGMSRALLKLSGSLVHDYATISDDSPSPNRASRARRAATSAGIS